jgi:signal transduction histidine kinase
MGEAIGLSGHPAPRHTWSSWVAQFVRSPLSVRAHVVGLILVVLAPLLLFSGFLVLRSAEHEQQIMGNSVRQRTQAAAAAIDHELGALQARLFVLAASNALRTGDVATFRTEALSFAREQRLAVVLSDPIGQQIVNTRAAADASLPMTTDPDAIKRVAATLQPSISDLTRGAVTQELFAGINVPVMRGDQVIYVLTLNVVPALPRMLAKLDLPPDWIAALVDRQGYTLARSREADRFVGQAGRPAIFQHFQAADEGWFPLISRDGVPVYNAFAHIGLAGWVVAIGIPDAVLFAPVQYSTFILALVGVVTLTCALLLAIAIGRRLALPMTNLVAFAALVGRGERFRPFTTGVLEADAVASSLQAASERLHRSAAERNQALSDLAQLNEERSELLQRTVVAQEVERKRIARELHDSLGQYLTALRLGFAAIEPHCAANDSARRGLTELKALAAELGRELNRMAWELRPMALDHLGLQRAVTQYLEEWAERSGLRIDLEVTLGDRRLPHDVETALFRVLQEAIANVMRHSGADEVAVVLKASDTEVRLIVEDNGRGFDTGSDEQLALDTRHLGLIGARERLALVKGRLEVESAPGAGTTIYITVPL